MASLSEYEAWYCSGCDETIQLEDEACSGCYRTYDQEYDFKDSDWIDKEEGHE